MFKGTYFVFQKLHMKGAKEYVHAPLASVHASLSELFAFERLRVLEKIGIRMLQIRNVCYVVSVNLLQEGVTNVSSG